MFNHALIVGKFAPFHKGHQLLIETALNESRAVTVLVYANPDFSNMPQAKRAGWITALYPQVTVLAPAAPPPDNADDHTHREFVKSYIAQMSPPIDAVFTSEAYGDGFAQHLNVQHRLVDQERATIPASGTVLRQDIHANRHFLHPTVYLDFVKRIALMGAESTGKSTLAAHLARQFGTNYMPEHGRDYYEKKNGILTLEDYVQIAKEHREIEDELALTANGLLFVDTNAITTLFYSYYYNGDALPELHDLANQCKARYACWLICGDDIPFEQDGWRDNAALRSKMQRMILMDLRNRGISFEVLEGSLEERTRLAIAHLTPQLARRAEARKA